MASPTTGRVVTGQHHLAGRDADPGRERIGEASSSAARRSLHLDRGPHRAQAVVLVGQRHAEDRDHRVADELLHPAAVALDGRAHLGEVALQDRAQQFGVVALSQAGRSDQIAEQRRHGPARLGRRYGGERPGALLAELRAVAVLVSTGGTDAHGAMLPSRGG